MLAIELENNNQAITDSKDEKTIKELERAGQKKTRRNDLHIPVQAPVTGSAALLPSYFGSSTPSLLCLFILVLSSSCPLMPALSSFSLPALLSSSMPSLLCLPVPALSSCFVPALEHLFVPALLSPFIHVLAQTHLTSSVLSTFKQILSD